MKKQTNTKPIEAHRDKDLGAQENHRRYLHWAGRMYLFKSYKVTPPLIIVRAD